MDHTTTSTFDIPGLVLATLSETYPMFADMGLVKPGALLIETLHMDEMDVMEFVQDISEDLDITVPFSDEDALNTDTATVQTAIDLFTRLNSEQHPTQQ